MPRCNLLFVQRGYFVRRWSRRCSIRSGCPPCVGLSSSSPTSSLYLIDGCQTSTIVHRHRAGFLHVDPTSSPINPSLFNNDPSFIVHPNMSDTGSFVVEYVNYRQQLHRYASRWMPQGCGAREHHRPPGCPFQNFRLYHAQCVPSVCLFVPCTAAAAGILSLRLTVRAVYNRKRKCKHTANPNTTERYIRNK